MKTPLHQLVLALSVAILPLSSCSIYSHAEKARGADLSRYKTFSWSTNERKSRASSEIIDNNIKEIAGEELEKKGLIKADTNPDLIIDYSVTLPRNERPSRRSAYSGISGQLFMGATGRSGLFLQPAMAVGNRYGNAYTSKGTLSINMLDANTKKLVWQGWANDNMNSRNITTKQVKNDLKAIFKKFDYQQQ